VIASLLKKLARLPVRALGSSAAWIVVDDVKVRVSSPTVTEADVGPWGPLQPARTGVIR
jgi:hypothetical protein